MEVEWSNYACLGYIIAAMRNKGFDDETIQQVVRGAQTQFDRLTIHEAEQVYLKSQF